MELTQVAERRAIETRAAEKPEISSIMGAVIATLAYHDLLNLPLTAVSCWRYLLRPRDSKFQLSAPSLKEVRQQLDQLVERGVIETKHGFYFFLGRRSLFKEWINKHARSQKKWKLLRKIVFWWQAIPFLRGVAGTGSLAFESAHAESDLDVLVIAAPNRVWTVRFFLTVFLDTFGLRRRPQGPVANRICLNHYLSEDVLTFPYRSLYTSMEYARLVPILGEETCRQFRAANREWMEGHLVQVFPDSLSHLKSVKKSGILRTKQRVGEFLLGGRIGDKLERFLAHFQQARIVKSKEAGAPGGRVIATETRAEFHPNSREAPLLNAFNQRMEALGLLSEFGNQKDSGLSA